MRRRAARADVDVDLERDQEVGAELEQRIASGWNWLELPARFFHFDPPDPDAELLDRVVVITLDGDPEPRTYLVGGVWQSRSTGIVRRVMMRRVELPPREDAAAVSTASSTIPQERPASLPAGTPILPQRSDSMALSNSSRATRA